MVLKSGFVFYCPVPVHCLLVIYHTFGKAESAYEQLDRDFFQIEGEVMT